VLLAIDIGNTHIVFGVFEDETLLHTFRVSSARTSTVDEYHVLLRELLALRGLGLDAIDASVLGSVVPPLNDAMGEAVERAFGRAPLVVGPGVKTGIAILYENPREIGADRIVNAVAAFERVKAGVLVVDFGTATTFDCVSPRGEYLGGVIVPGVHVSLDALLTRAAKLSRVEIAEPPRVVGRNTAHAVQSGIVHGYSSLVDGLVDKLRAELEFPCRVVATGGLAPLISRHTRTVELVDPNLTLTGLRILYTRNAVRQR
jgi:type III pantothenate kinase